ncbi:preprotein translocase subunit SecE [Mycolicibacterium vaccae]|uniref:Protein translocase subunit SecE n=1 Tax=Mycolicibacterium vaccae ATCC 25954 TaxID=1194972 RepID=K0V100_MYCVA|nr:preprotein translocase subunit SecE [Mycolicibacterium vaccae]ANI38268.1 preprotein translocase subunit SecE [Mycolicibacterium vaccae 95051]EJZ10950.1 preprotein translocase subunit SecE [Mycolicibacterium vaccae ATCC 25954]MCV7063873.1 preprotein translocase subunit SecE [Mycolicibacterium vaccae]
MSDERDGVSSADTDSGAQTDDGDTRGQTAVVTRPLRPTGKRTRRASEALDKTSDKDEDTDKAPDTDASGSKDDDGKGPKAKKKTARQPKDGPSRNPIAFVINYLKEVVGELRKVIWPNRKQMVTYTTVVLIFLVFMVALIGGVDLGLAKLVTWVFG